MAKVKEVKEESLKSPYLKKKVTIALIKRQQSSLYSDIELSTLATGGEKSFMCPINDLGNLIDPLTKEERLFFEDELGIDLNVHKKRDNFWNTKQAMCRLRKLGRKTETANMVLDLEKNPYHYIIYKIALINPRVAKSWKERYDSREFEFVILDGEVELEEELNYTAMEDDVQEYLRKNKNSKRKLFDLLRMYGVQNASKQVNFTNSTEWIYNELKKASRKPSEIKKLYTLVTLGERDISSKVFLADCVTIGLVDKHGFEYRLSGGDKISNNEAEAITWFEDKRNSSVRARFEQAIEEYYENSK